MSDGITVSLTVTQENAAAYLSKKITQYNRTITPTGLGGPSPGRVALTTADTVIDLSAFTTPGLLVITNHSSSNYIEFGPTAAGALVVLGKLLPGEVGFFRLGVGVVLRAKANTATCICSFDILET